MNWFSNLFKKKSKGISKSEKNELHKKWLLGYEAFKKGKQFFLNKQDEEALTYFDLALEYGFDNDENFYLDRALCLQKLDYHYDALMDFDKAILLDPNDCNMYFCRSFSRWSTLDLEGRIDDLRKAVELSKEDTEMNSEYEDEAKKMGWDSGATGIYQSYLRIAEYDLKSEINEKERLLNATLEVKAYFEKQRNGDRERKLERIKRREANIK